jgi:acetyl-CoA synthetase
MLHPAVLEAGVVGVPDPDIGQRVKAYITLKPGHDPSPALAAAITEKVKTVIAPYKAPKDVDFVTELPKTATGKILRRELRARGRILNRGLTSFGGSDARKPRLCQP